MWVRRYYIHSSEAPPPQNGENKITPDIISSALHAAIDKRDTALARQTLEEAFWNKIVFTPDVLHLCRALVSQDRSMIRLLATYGAMLTPAEAAVVAGLLEERRLSVQILLRDAGIRAWPDPAEGDKNLTGRITEELARKDLQDHFGKLGLGKKTLAALTGLPNRIRLNADQSVLALDGLHNKMKEADKTHALYGDILESLVLMKNTNADFSKVETARYLGKDAPGLAKLLLDNGIVSAENFDMKVLTKKVGGELRIFTRKEEKNYAYTEFLCQVLLEIADAVRYIPLRAQPDADYQKEFRDKWANASQNLHMSYRLKGPSL